MLLIFKAFVAVSHAKMVVPVMRTKKPIYVIVLHHLVVTTVKVTVPNCNQHYMIPQRITLGQ